MLHVTTARHSSSRADIEDRLTGKFYTPHVIAEALAADATSAGSPSPQSICDPFCGDGRLVVAWLRQCRDMPYATHLKKIALWDYDEAAVSVAAAAVSNELSQLGRSDVEIECFVGDTFTRWPSSKFDLVITNPPWEQLKPDSRDEVHDGQRYRTQIRSYGAQLQTLFPEASACRRRTIGGYTVNLARAGALAALRLTSPGGQMLIVLPSTIFADQVSDGFRRSFFSEAQVQQLNLYPAEARLFRGVDQSFVTVRARAGLSTTSYKLKRHRPDLSLLEERIYVPKQAADSLPLGVGGSEYALIEEMQNRHPSLKWLEDDLRFGLRLGRELDETRIADFYSEDDEGVPFVKGRNVGRFTFESTGLPRVDKKKRKIPVSSGERRVAWRDVSRPSQKRRMQACVIPSGYVTGNSLGIARFSSNHPNLLETLATVLNSVVFESQIRSRLATNHVSQGAIRGCAVPYSIFEDKFFLDEVGSLISNCSIYYKIEARLEIMIAKKYGLSREEFLILLHSFGKIPASEIDTLMSKEAWS